MPRGESMSFKNKQVEKKCLLCERPYKVNPRLVGSKFCSRKCQFRWVKEQAEGRRIAEQQRCNST